MFPGTSTEHPHFPATHSAVVHSTLQDLFICLVTHKFGLTTTCSLAVNSDNFAKVHGNLFLCFIATGMSNLVVSEGVLPRTLSRTLFDLCLLRVVPRFFAYPQSSPVYTYLYCRFSLNVIL